MHLGQVEIDADDYVVTVYVTDDSGWKVPIASVVGYPTGCHIDRLYLPTGNPQRRADTGLSAVTIDGAIQYICEDGRWRAWVERYDDNHGLP